MKSPKKSVNQLAQDDHVSLILVFHLAVFVHELESPIVHPVGYEVVHIAEVVAHHTFCRTIGFKADVDYSISKAKTASAFSNAMMSLGLLMFLRVQLNTNFNFRAMGDEALMGV